MAGDTGGTTERIRFGLIGTGNFGPWFAQFLNEVGELVAICDPNAGARKNFADVSGLRLPEFGRVEELLEMDLDAVAITGPNDTHKAATLAAARKGRHVFCEKTMAPSVPDCWEMVKACEAAGVRLMVGHKRRLRRPWARMAELVGEVGEPAAISVTGYFDARKDDFRGWWCDESRSGGILALSGVHELDWMRAIGGDVASVSAVNGPLIDGLYGFPDSIQVVLKFRSGAVGSLGVSLSYPLLRYRQVCGAEVVTRNGGMRLVSSFREADLYWQKATDEAPRHEHYEDADGDPVGAREAFRQELGDFVRWITEGRTPCLTWREGLRCVELIEAARRSAREGGAWLQLPLYPDLEK